MGSDTRKDLWVEEAVQAFESSCKAVRQAMSDETLTAKNKIVIFAHQAKWLMKEVEHLRKRIEDYEKVNC